MKTPLLSAPYLLAVLAARPFLGPGGIHAPELASGNQCPAAGTARFFRLVSP